ncbi:hypothetical protein BCR34DRAFT_649419 [Clohesyomyces aquaticus]|uniref:Ig-like domain-containing protein n=1 Tax=Clohesyomyces aquaticus TaxID=1231657 RepID=A0A1Y1ZSR4_9PLEO|nr:hypothetical protein BCR34DRAFT_649419 [Clohesyomyces aquaticus]
MYTTIVFALVSSVFVAATIPVNVEVDTECKTCPYSLCPNKLSYDWEYDTTNKTLNCWTEGTPIVNDTTWLKTSDGCYVTQYDLKEYAGDYTNDLPYCGHVSPRWTKAEGRTRYMTQCNLGPWVDRNVIKNYKYGVDLHLTCVSPRVGEEILGKKKWYKTSSNCYVSETTLWPVEDEHDLDDCGPIPRRLSLVDRVPETTTVETSTPTPFPKPSVVSTPTASPTPKSMTRTAAHVESRHKFQRRFLYNDTIGEEYVNCTANGFPPSNPGRVVRLYEFRHEVILQCGSMYNDTIFLFTTDFCWIKDAQTFEQLTTSTERTDYFPHCERFTDLES